MPPQRSLLNKKQMEPTRFNLGLAATFFFGGWWLAQLATSFPLVRWGCLFVLLSGFLLIGIDALFDKAKAEREGYYGSAFNVITPHLGAAILFLFMIVIGVFAGYSRECLVEENGETAPRKKDECVVKVQS